MLKLTVLLRLHYESSIAIEVVPGLWIILPDWWTKSSCVQCTRTSLEQFSSFNGWPIIIIGDVPVYFLLDKIGDSWLLS